MKHLILTISLSLLAICNASAQTEKGSKLIGSSIGSISNNNTKYTTSYSNSPTIYSSTGKYFNVGLYPNIGFFVIDNLAIGASLNLSISKSESKSSNSGSVNTSTTKSTNPSLGLSPFARYYLSKSTSGKPFIELSLSGNRYGGKSKSESSGGGSSETKTNPKFDRGAAFRIGYEHFLTANIGIYGAVGVQFSSTKSSYTYTPSQGSGYSYTQTYKSWYTPINFGFQMHLVKGKKVKKGKK